MFHKVLKSGCSIEKSQLRGSDGLKKLIALKSIIAWRIFWLSRTLRERGSQNCESVLTREEWQILYKKFNQTKLPKMPPTVKDIYYWIAKLGGHIGRKSDHPPGIISMWRGWSRFIEVVEDYKDFYG